MTYLSFLIQLEFLLRIFVAGICGSIIGYERKNRNKEAGIRTHAIVSLAAALIIIVSKYGFYDIVNYDASRVAAQIVSGIGFLGAGIIFVRNNTVNGLTTAAGIWATAGVGMAIGSGLYFIGICVAIFIVLVQILMHSRQFLFKEPYHETFSLVVNNGGESLVMVRRAFEASNLELVSMHMEKRDTDRIYIELDVLLPPGYDKNQLITIFSSCSSVISVTC